MGAKFTPRGKLMLLKTGLGSCIVMLDRNLNNEERQF
jgi:hypothetical protein